MIKLPEQEKGDSDTYATDKDIFHSNFRMQGMMNVLMNERPKYIDARGEENREKLHMLIK